MSTAPAGPGHESARHATALASLLRAVFESDGRTQPATREAAAAGSGLPEPLGSYVRTVRDASYRIADSDLAALKAAGYDEEELFEVTVAAALGRARTSLDAGLRAVRGDRAP